MPEEKNQAIKEEPVLSGPDGRRDNFGELLAEIEKNSQETLRLTKKINNFIIWQKIFAVIKILIIAIPVILAWRLIDSIRENPAELFNNPWLNSYADQIIELIGKKIDPAALDLNNIDPDKIPPEYRQLLNR